MADFQQNNEEKFQEQREVLEREYANKQADLALREQQIAEAEAKLRQLCLVNHQL